MNTINSIISVIIIIIILAHSQRLFSDWIIIQSFIVQNSK